MPVKSHLNHETTADGGDHEQHPVELSKRTITMNDGRYMIFYTEKGSKDKTTDEFAGEEKKSRV